MDEWEHLFKLDPAKQLTNEQLKELCHSGTDGIIIGGTDDVTLDNVVDLFARVTEYDIPCGLEVSTKDAIAPGFDFYLIPMVLNSTEKKWMMDIQHDAIKHYRKFLELETIITEGYCILNEEAKAYKQAACSLPTKEDVLAYAYMAEHMLRMPVFYVEYSGTYGDVSLVEEVKQELHDTLLFYGGGIETLEQAEEMKQHADVIIVGNSIYTNFDEALQTVEAKHIT